MGGFDAFAEGGGAEVIVGEFFHGDFLGGGEGGGGEGPGCSALAL